MNPQYSKTLQDFYFDKFLKKTILSVIVLPGLLILKSS